MGQIYPSFPTITTTSIRPHIADRNVTTTSSNYVPLTASLHAGALITGARLDVGLFAFFFIFLAENVI